MRRWFKAYCVGSFVFSVFILVAPMAEAQINLNRVLDAVNDALQPRPAPPPPAPAETRPAPPPPAAAQPQPARQGLPRAVVAEIQQRLNDLGYDAGPVDGIEGSRTRGAAAAWRRDSGLDGGGRLSRDLLYALRTAPGAPAVAESPAAPSQAPSARPSFDCARAASRDELAICASSDLARLDRDLNAAFRDAMAGAGEDERARISRDQRDWLARRRACGADQGCLSDTMSGRIAALGGAAGGGVASAAGAGGAAGVGAPGRLPRYADYVRLALKAAPDVYADAREQAGIAWRFAVAGPDACRDFQQRLPGWRQDVFAARDFAVESARLLDAELARLVATPDSLEIVVTSPASLQQYDLQRGGYPVNGGVPLRPGSINLTQHAADGDGRTPPPCRINPVINPALGGVQGQGAGTRLTSLMAEAEAPRVEAFLPMAEDAARAFQQRNPSRRVELAARLRLTPPQADGQPLRAEVLAMELRDGGRVLHAFDVNPPPPEAAPEAPAGGYADFVHMAMMSDLDAYLAEAGDSGLAYLFATGTEARCAQLLEPFQRRDEFGMADAREAAAERFRAVAATLPGRPRRGEVAFEAWASFAEYDDARGGFPLRAGQDDTAIPRGAVNLRQEPAPRSCRNGAYAVRENPFDGLQAAYDPVPGIDFVPMAEPDARAFRAAGKSGAVLRARVEVTPREQGRGPLQGRVISVVAVDRDSGEELHRFDVAPPPATPGDGTRPLDPALHAAFIAPLLVADLPQDRLDRAALQYFQSHQRQIDDGNPPGDMPLPLAEVRGKPPEQVVVEHRDALRAALAAAAPETPLRATLEPGSYRRYEEGEGLKVVSFEDRDPRGLSAGDGEPWSARGRPIYPLFDDGALRRRGLSLAEAALAYGRTGVGLLAETDRLLQTPRIPLPVEEAAARGLLYGASDPDTVEARWEFRIEGARMENGRPLLELGVLGVSYRWRSDGAEIASFAAEDLPAPAMAGTEAAAEDGPRPPASLDWGGETTDLLLVRDAPDLVPDAVIDRMMLSRLTYEQQATRQKQEPEWGRFFPPGRNAVTEESFAAMRDDFVAWTRERAGALPETATLRLHMYGGASPLARQVNGGPHYYGCRNAEAQASAPGATRQAAMQARLCAYLEAAWTAPEPVLFLPQQEGGAIYHGPALRGSCGPEDIYCRSIRNARRKVGAPEPAGELVALDRVPVIDAALSERLAAASDEMLVLELDVRPAGVRTMDAWPESGWNAALESVQDFQRRERVGNLTGPRRNQPRGEVLLFEAETVAARVVNPETGVVLAEPPLVASAPQPDDLLAPPESETAALDVLGVTLGMPFEDADKLIRDHMAVGRVLAADRSRQMATVSGRLEPYGSGRMYVREDGGEMIAIFDEPPAAPGRVLGLWRVLNLPAGAVNPAGLKATLVERYGEPDSTRETAFASGKGVTFAWSDYAPEQRCAEISERIREGVWLGEDGGPAPALDRQGRHAWPSLGDAHAFGDAEDEPRPPSSFCPATLGVRFLSFPQGNRLEGDEIVVWLTDQRAYADLYYKSRETRAEGEAPAAASGGGIKF